MSRWTEIRYKCACMKAEAVINVPERGSVEDVREFVERVQGDVSRDHRRLSPRCRSRTMEYAKIPVEGDVIGGAKGGTA